jgi:hypothetical protein
MKERYKNYIKDNYSFLSKEYKKYNQDFYMLNENIFSDTLQIKNDNVADYYEYEACLVERKSSLHDENKKKDLFNSTTRNISSSIISKTELKFNINLDNHLLKKQIVNVLENYLKNKTISSNTPVKINNNTSINLNKTYSNNQNKSDQVLIHHNVEKANGQFISEIYSKSKSKSSPVKIQDTLVLHLHKSNSSIFHKFNIANKTIIVNNHSFTDKPIPIHAVKNINKTHSNISHNVASKIPSSNHNNTVVKIQNKIEHHKISTNISSSHSNHSEGSNKQPLHISTHNFDKNKSHFNISEEHMIVARKPHRPNATKIHSNLTNINMNKHNQSENKTLFFDNKYFSLNHSTSNHNKNKSSSVVKNSKKNHHNQTKQNNLSKIHFKNNLSKIHSNNSKIKNIPQNVTVKNISNHTIINTKKKTNITQKHNITTFKHHDNLYKNLTTKKNNHTVQDIIHITHWKNNKTENLKNNNTHLDKIHLIMMNNSSVNKTLHHVNVNMNVNKSEIHKLSNKFKNASAVNNGTFTISSSNDKNKTISNHTIEIKKTEPIFKLDTQKLLDKINFETAKSNLLFTTYFNLIHTDDSNQDYINYTKNMSNQFLLNELNISPPEKLNKMEYLILNNSMIDFFKEKLKNLKEEVKKKLNDNLSSIKSLNDSQTSSSEMSKYYNRSYFILLDINKKLEKEFFIHKNKNIQDVLVEIGELKIFNLTYVKGFNYLNSILNSTKILVDLTTKFSEKIKEFSRAIENNSDLSNIIDDLLQGDIPDWLDTLEENKKSETYVIILSKLFKLFKKMLNTINNLNSENSQNKRLRNLMSTFFNQNFNSALDKSLKEIQDMITNSLMSIKDNQKEQNNIYSMIKSDLLNQFSQITKNLTYINNYIFKKENEILDKKNHKLKLSTQIKNDSIFSTTNQPKDNFDSEDEKEDNELVNRTTQSINKILSLKPNLPTHTLNQTYNNSNSSLSEDEGVSVFHIDKITISLIYNFICIFLILIYLAIFKKILLFSISWGLGIGDWGLGIGPNPQSPIPNQQLSHLKIFFYSY